MTRRRKRTHHPAKMQSAQKLPPGGISMILKRLAIRTGKWLLQFLWQQVKWWLWIGGFLAGSYLAMYLHYMWVGAILLWVAILIAIGWFMQLIKYEEHDYSDRSSRPRESPIEIQQKEMQEDIDRYQREQEDHHA